MRLPRVPEKIVQSQGCNLLRSVGGAVYVLGTRRPRGDYQGTRQTPGLADVYAFLPAIAAREIPMRALWWEAKADGGRPSPEQLIFGARCASADHDYVRGGVDALVAYLIRTRRLKPDQIAQYRTPAATESV
jgi:hypothetical protein